MSNTNVILRHTDTRIKRLLDSIKTNLITNNITSDCGHINIEKILLKDGKICTSEPGILTNIYPQDQDLTKNSSPIFKTLTVSNLIVEDDSYIPVNPEPKMLTSVSIFLNNHNNKFTVPFDCYISAISSCVDKTIILEINSNNVVFEKQKDLEYKLFQNDIIKNIGFDIFLILSFYEKKREIDNIDIKKLETELLDLKNIVYTMTGRL